MDARATMHSKGGQPGHTCAHGWRSHVYSYLLGLGYDQV